MKTIKIFLKKKKGKKCEYAPNQYRKLFVENEISEEEKNRKHQYACNLYNDL